MEKRAQAWGFDLMMATAVFFLGIATIYLYSLNFPLESEETIKNMQYEGNIIAENILSDGSPINWNITNVAKLGILTNNIINDTKMEQFYLLSSTEYARTKSLFGAKYNYYVNLSEPISINGEQKSGIGALNENAENLIKISRFTIYKNKSVTLYVYIWE